MKPVKYEISNAVRNRVSTSKHNFKISNFGNTPSIELGFPSFLKLIVSIADSVESDLK